jgi:hypothetical protein
MISHYEVFHHGSDGLSSLITKDHPSPSSMYSMPYGRIATLAESLRHAYKCRYARKMQTPLRNFFEKYHLDVIADRTLRKPLLHYTQQNFWSRILGRSNRQAIHL